jgi:hypothetical protein
MLNFEPIPEDQSPKFATPLDSILDLIVRIENGEVSDDT